MRLIKITFGWIVGVIIYEFIKSQWQNEVMDWEGIVHFSIAGFIGILIGFGLKKFFKKEKS
ncbi:hypothetical protein [Virgibacillus kimchii]